MRRHTDLYVVVVCTCQMYSNPLWCIVHGYGCRTWKAVRKYVCDGCMATVTARDVAVWADFEHVLCRTCAAQDSQ